LLLDEREHNTQSHAKGKGSALLFVAMQLCSALRALRIGTGGGCLRQK